MCHTNCCLRHRNHYPRHIQNHKTTYMRTYSYYMSRVVVRQHTRCMNCHQHRNRLDNQTDMRWIVQNRYMLHQPARWNTRYIPMRPMRCIGRWRMSNMPKRTLRPRSHYMFPPHTRHRRHYRHNTPLHMSTDTNWLWLCRNMCCVMDHWNMRYNYYPNHSTPSGTLFHTRHCFQHAPRHRTTYTH